jgi:hypothetical protein
VDILDIGNCDSGKMETGIPVKWKPVFWNGKPYNNRRQFTWRNAVIGLF